MKRHISGLLLSLLFISLHSGACSKKENSKNPPEIAVANSYLGCVVKDICGSQIEILSLSPPGMCPGHFDISPSQVNQLCNCKILFVFDFQQNIENVITRIRDKGLKMCSIAPPDGLCIPETYLSIVKEVVTALSEEEPSQKSFYESRTSKIENRMKSLKRELLQQIEDANLKSCNVIVSRHQAEFAEWLGLNPVSVFVGSDEMTPSQINNNLQNAGQKKIDFVIANKQEGTEFAGAFSEYIKTRMVVFSNFPVENTQQPGFDALASENVNNLIGALK
jgi:zinc transport system substrate-binding protein